MLNYDGHKWGHNGPDMITRVAKSLCDLKGSIKEPLNCANLTILPKTKCYEIGYYEWKHFYDIKHAANDMQRLKESYFVHFWNKMNQLEKLQSFTNSSTPYVQASDSAQADTTLLKLTLYYFSWLKNFVRKSLQLLEAYFKVLYITLPTSTCAYQSILLPLANLLSRRCKSLKL